MAKILDDLKQLKEELAAAEAREAEEVEVVEEEDQPVEVDDEPEEKASEDEEAPSDSTEPEVPTDEKPKTPSDYRKERLEKKRLEEELAALRDEVSSLKAPKPTHPVNNDPEPDPEDEVAHLKWQVRQATNQLREVNTWRQEFQRKSEFQEILTGAERQFGSYEREFAARVPDYEAAAQHYAGVLATSIKLLQPNIGDVALQQMVKQRILTRAAELQKEGWENPVDGMYEEAKKFGYRKAEATANDEGKTEIKPDLAKIAANKKRSAGTGGAAGMAKGEVTLKSFASMKPKDLAKLAPAERRRVLEESYRV